MIGLRNESVDGGLELDEGAEDAALEAAPRELGEEAFDGVEPGAGSWGEVEDEAGMAAEPGLDLRMVVGGVVVDDDVDDLARRHLRLDGVEEADELLMAVALHAAPDDLTFKHVESGEECGRAVADVIVRHGAEPPLLHRQAGLAAIEGLNLALLIDRQHDGVSWRIDVEADDLAELVGEGLVDGELELANPARLQAVGTPDALHRADADPCGLGHCRRRPMRRLAGRVG